MGLTLVNFNHDSIWEKQLDTINIRSYWQEMEFWGNAKGFNEKFTLFSGYGRDDGVWENANKKLNFKLNSPFRLGLEFEWLVLNETDSINLFALGLNETGFSIEKVNFETSKYLLKFSHSSNPNVMGRCGGGIELGFILLDLSDRKKPTFKKIKVESCYDNLWQSEETEKKGNIQIHKYLNNDDSTFYQLHINMDNLTFKEIGIKN